MFSSLYTLLKYNALLMYMIVFIIYTDHDLKAQFILEEDNQVADLILRQHFDDT